MSVSAIVLAYITSHPFVGILVIGPRSQEQLHDLLADAELTLTPEQLRYLTTAEGVLRSIQLQLAPPLAAGRQPKAHTARLT